MEPSLNIVVYIQLIFKSSLSAMRPHFVCLNWHSDPGATNVGFELSYIGTSEMNWPYEFESEHPVWDVYSKKKSKKNHSLR